MAPMPELMPISARTGPLKITIAAADEDVEPLAEMPADAIASTAGKYSGRQPAITALTATFSTSYSQ